MAAVKNCIRLFLSFLFSMHSRYLVRNMSRFFPNQNDMIFGWDWIYSSILFLRGVPLRTEMVDDTRVIGR